MPGTALEMKKLLIQYMAKHPVGQYFKILRQDQEISGNSKYYFISFYREFEHSIHRFSMSFKQQKRGSIVSFKVDANFPYTIAFKTLAVQQQQNQTGTALFLTKDGDLDYEKYLNMKFYRDFFSFYEKIDEQMKGVFYNFKIIYLMVNRSLIDR